MGIFTQNKMDLMDLDDNQLLSKNNLVELNGKFEKELQTAIAEKLKKLSRDDKDAYQNDEFHPAEYLRKAQENSELKREQHLRNRQIVKECKKLSDDVEKSDKKSQFVSERIEIVEKDLTLNKQELKRMGGYYKKAIQKYASVVDWTFEVQESENPKELPVTATFAWNGKTNSMFFVIDREQRRVVDWNLLGDSKDIEQPSDYKEVLKELMDLALD